MNMQKITCDDCGQSVPGYDVIHYGSPDEGFQKLCTQCFNAAVALRSGVDGFENIKLEPIGITDCAGELHQFYFQTRLLGNMVTIDGFELLDGNPDGYKFQITGEPEDDLFVLLGQLVQKIRRTLSIKYLVRDERHGLQIKDMAVCGRIESSYPEVERVPVMIIDGREISWDKFGQMLMSYEGWQFRLEICDRSDEL